MKKAVILFSGQGAQFDGMGLDFYQADPDFQAGIAQATQLPASKYFIITASFDCLCIQCLSTLSS